MMTKVSRIVNIWKERQVFDSNIIKMLKSVARGEKIADGGWWILIEGLFFSFEMFVLVLLYCGLWKI